MRNKASIITIGDEILIGQIVDTNSAYLAKQLDDWGFEVVELIAISDREQAIRQALAAQAGAVDLVLITGGLGPTKDDVTRAVFCDFFEDFLVENTAVLQHVTQLIEAYYKRPITEVNKQQAWVPSRSQILFNRVGTAPGMLMQKSETVFVSMPGVPFEMMTIVEEELKPWVLNHFQGDFNFHRTFVTYGIGESLLAEYLATWEDALPDGVSLAYLPSPGRVRMRLSTAGEDREQLEALLQSLIDQLPEQVLPFVASWNDEGLEVAIAQQLTQSGRSIAFAESCTGGKLCELFAAMPGASAYLRGGVVTYATDTKTSVLGVAQADIEQYGVVSAEVARAMAAGIQRLMQSDYAIATTGNAGPTQGDDRAELGTVFLGIATPNGVFTREYQFGQPREKVVNSAVAKGLQIISAELFKNK